VNVDMCVGFVYKMCSWYKYKFGLIFEVCFEIDCIQIVVVIVFVIPLQKLQ
jgi:hypothetical protein